MCILMCMSMCMCAAWPLQCQWRIGAAAPVAFRSAERRWGNASRVASGRRALDAPDEPAHARRCRRPRWRGVAFCSKQAPAAHLPVVLDELDVRHPQIFDGLLHWVKVRRAKRSNSIGRGPSIAETVCWSQVCAVMATLLLHRGPICVTTTLQWTHRDAQRCARQGRTWPASRERQHGHGPAASAPCATLDKEASFLLILSSLSYILLILLAPDSDTRGGRQSATQTTPCPRPLSGSTPDRPPRASHT